MILYRTIKRHNTIVAAHLNMAIESILHIIIYSRSIVFSHTIVRDEFDNIIILLSTSVELQRTRTYVSCVERLN